jgi:hypothetical protein
LVELGMYLYTTALYSLECYNYNTTQTYIPKTAGSDYSANHDFLPRAMNDFDRAFAFYPNPDDATGTYNPLTFTRQPFQGRAMSETMISDSQAGSLSDPSLYQFSQGDDHRTSHVTYIYQGQVRCDNTYWNSPVGMISTSIYPHGPFSLALARIPGYMSDWINAIHFQNGRSYYQLSYPTTVNLLSALLGNPPSLIGVDNSSSYATTSNPGGSIIPIPGPAGSFDYSPQSGESSLNPQENAFLYLAVNDELTPWLWYWQLCSNINQYEADSGDLGVPPWISETTGETLSMYVPADSTEAETLLYFYSYQLYGAPNFTCAVIASWTDPTPAGPPLLPMAAAWSNVDAQTQQTTWTYIIYNPNSESIDVYFQNNSGLGQSQTQTVGGFQLFWWTETI